jgi:predicted nuclease with TOPRIM domain
MATIQSNPEPKTNRTPLLAGIIGVLLIALIALGIGFMNRGNENAELSTDLVEMEQFKAQAEKQYYESLAELEEMRGSNEELNAMIDQQKEELRLQNEKISSLTRDSRNLAAARRELADLKAKTTGYLAELEELRAANAALAEDRDRLATERDLISNDLQVSQQTNEQLNNERAVLVSEREELAEKNSELSKKVNIASVIKTNNITVEGQKQRNSGRWVGRNNAKNVERIYVCFNSLDNAVAKAGEETFQMRIINPTGETLSIEAAGSGVLTTDSGEQIPYTKNVPFNFQGDAANHCAEWAGNGQEFAEGTYTVELYNKGVLVGNSELELR